MFCFFLFVFYLIHIINKIISPPMMHTVVGVFRLQDERAKEEELHKVMAELAQPLEPTPPEENQEMDGVDYIAQVEHLQQLVFNASKATTQLQV